MTKEQFIKEVTKNVNQNIAETLDFLDDNEDNSFDEWMHHLSDNGLDMLFHKYE